METVPTVKKRLRPFQAKWQQFWSEPWFAIATIILAAAILIFIVAPVFAVLLKSFGIGTGQLTFDYYKEFFQASYYWEALKNSLLSAIITTVVVLFLSINIALYVTRTKNALSKSFKGIALLPLVAPPFIFSLSLMILFGRSGIVTDYVSDLFGGQFSIYGFWGVVVAQIIGYFPIGYMLIESTMRNSNADLEYAALDLGSNQWKTLGTVTLPLAKSGIIKAGLLVFVMALATSPTHLLLGEENSF
ncbi:ABC transporter permease [Virgibacillus alimentarius]|uniref:ABC transporter permease n=1 Tax=Virgibacillus alimentarius TaxID=698769 RepID=UPI00068BF4B7|nr:ABC transporter permease subunit [Virgibacillus alimentarius]